MTGLLGGALASHLRAGSPVFSRTLFSVYFGVFMWASLWLRDERIRKSFPLVSPNRLSLREVGFRGKRILNEKRKEIVMPNTIRLHRVIATKPEKVYRAFLEPDAAASWLPPFGLRLYRPRIECQSGRKAQNVIPELHDR